MNNVKRALSVNEGTEAKPEEMTILHSDVKQEHVENPTPTKVNAKKGISYKIKEIRRTLIHLLCGSGMLKIFMDRSLLPCSEETGENGPYYTDYFICPIIYGPFSIDHRTFNPLGTGKWWSF